MRKIFTFALILAVVFAGCAKKIPQASTSSSAPQSESSSASAAKPSSASAQSESSKSESSKPEPKPDSAAERFLEDVSDLNDEEIESMMQEYFSTQSLPKAYYSLLKPISERMNYTVGNAKVDGDKAMVDVAITNINAKTALDSVATGAIAHLAMLQLTGRDVSNPEKILADYAVENIKWDELPTIKTDTTLYLVKGADGEWKVDGANPDNIGFLNALTGGAIDAVESYKTLLQSFNKQ